MEQKESFTVELVLADGEIVDVIAKDDDVDVEFAENIGKFSDETKQRLMKTLSHGSMILSGQNSPGCIVIKTSTGYIRICR